MLSDSVVGQRYLAEHLTQGRTVEDLIGALCRQVETYRCGEVDLKGNPGRPDLETNQDLLREHGFQLGEAQRIAHIGSWELDLRDLSSKWSEETFRIFGYDPISFTPTKAAFYGVVHPEDLERVRAADVEISAGGPGKSSIGS
ncbi:MAG: PAS domain-containing protein [Holophagaceae bacterium]|nr:PAS domain-containing protein [Holophagaceae bacterium]